MNPRWLDDREQRAWRGFVRMRSEVFGHLARQLSRNSGISESDFEVLVVVSEAPDQRIRARELGRELGWERSRLSHQIARMERRGTVRRITCESDARGFDVVLTPAGLEAITAAAPLHVNDVRGVFADVLSPDELEALATITEKVVGHIRTNHPGPCSG